MSSEISKKDADIGLHLFGRNRYIQAIPYLERALSNDPHNDFLLNVLASCQLFGKRANELALQTINMALSLNPDNADHYATKAQIITKFQYVSDNDAKEELSLIERSLALDPELFRAHAIKADLFLKLRKYSLAEQSMRSALALRPDSTYAQGFLARVAKLQNKRDLSHQLTMQALSQNPDEEDLFINLGWLALGKKDHLKAAEYFREALRLNPHQDEARRGLIESLKLNFSVYRKMASVFYELSNLKHFVFWRNGYIALLWLTGLFASKVETSAMLTGAASFLFLIPVSVVFIDFFTTYVAWKRGLINNNLLLTEKVLCITLIDMVLLHLFIFSSVFLPMLPFNDFILFGGIMVLPICWHITLVLEDDRRKRFLIWLALIPTLIVTLCLIHFIPGIGLLKDAFAIVGIVGLSLVLFLPIFGFIDFLNQKKYLQPSSFSV